MQVQESSKLLQWFSRMVKVIKEVARVVLGLPRCFGWLLCYSRVAKVF